MLLVVTFAPPALAQVRAEIGIQLPGPPPFVVIPGAPVYAAPRAPANVFFYAHHYWVFDTRWYVGPTWTDHGRSLNPCMFPGLFIKSQSATTQCPRPLGADVLLLSDRRGKHITGVSGAKTPPSEIGAPTRSARIGRGRAARRDSPSRDVADDGPKPWPRRRPMAASICCSTTR